MENNESFSLEADEKELLQEELTGLTERHLIILTNKRLIIGLRKLRLEDISEVDSIVSGGFNPSAKMIVKLKNGEEITAILMPSVQPSTDSLLADSQNAIVKAVRATHNHWAETINKLLK